MLPFLKDVQHGVLRVHRPFEILYVKWCCFVYDVIVQHLESCLKPSVVSHNFSSGGGRYIRLEGGGGGGGGLYK